ncbi:SGNH/GDSL hydrolase family protein (plasmid) [Clostridium perfringens]|uniref:SGNH/GDSL hydrolase family protein n=1 Tax=Clostridium perfringens TaxID=1502 RepID=UPI003F437D3A
MKEIKINVDNYNENSIKTIEGDNLSEVYKIYICKNKRRIDLTNKIAIMAYVNEYGNKKSNILALNITNASQGEIELPITNVISSENGVYACQIAIYGENNSLEQTAPFSLIVENNIFSKISNTAINSSDFHILSEAIKTTSEYAEKLKQGTENIELQYANKLHEINSQLDNTYDKQDVDKKIFHMPNMGQDIKEAMTGGSVAVVGENAVSGINIIDGQVFGYKTDFVEIDDYSNLLDRRTIKKDYLINGGVDGKEKPQSGFFVTDFIKVKPNTKYYFGNLYGGYYAYYDGTKNYIGGLGIADNSTELRSPFTTPENAYYIRMTSNKLENSSLCWVSRSPEKVDIIKYILGNDVKLNSILIDKIIDNSKKEVFNYVQDNFLVKETNTDYLKKYGFANPIEKEKIKANTYIVGAEDGREKSASGLFATDFCIIEPQTKYYWGNLYEGHYAFYDENKRYISGSGIAPSETDLKNPFTTPSNAKYVRFTIDKEAKTKTCWINKENKIPNDVQEYVLASNIYTAREKVEKPKEFNPVDYNGWEISVFNKIVCIGDSLTEGTFNSNDGGYPTYKKYSYPTHLTKLTGVETTNLGKGGYTSKRWWDEMQNQSFAGHDCAIIQLGVNDVAVASQNVTPELTKQYLQNIIDKLKRENTGIKIFVAGITKSKWYSNSNYQARNEVIKEFASNREEENIYFIDLMKYSRNYDKPFAAGHLTALGYLQQAKEYKNYISYLIHKNLDNFKNVQFIGTDKEPI